MRDALISALLEEAERDPSLVFITGDLGFMAVEPLRDRLGERFINGGVAEQNIIGVAAGLARTGFRPFVYSMAPFVTLRCLEAVRVSLCQSPAPVTLIGVGSGYSYGNQGASHHAVEELAAVTALPGMTVVAPSDPWEVGEAVAATRSLDGPLYLRLAKSGEERLPVDVRRFVLGRLSPLREGDEAVIFATGEAVGRCLAVCEALAERGIDTALYAAHTLKPFDRDGVAAAGAGRWVFTVEQHVAHGGLGSMVAMALAESGVGAKGFHAFTLADEFKRRCGDTAYLERLDGLAEDQLVEAIERRVRGAEDADR